MIEDAIFTRLTQVAGVSSLVVNATSPLSYRIYHNIIPQHAQGDLTKMPCIVMTIDGEERQIKYEGTDSVMATSFQIDCYALTSLGSRQLADAVRDALMDFQGTVNGIDVGPIHLLNGFSLPDPEPGLHRFTRSYQVWHEES